MPEAVVVGLAHHVLGEVPVALVVPGPGGIEARRVLAECRTRLADYKVPAEIREIAAVPRTASWWAVWPLATSPLYEPQSSRQVFQEGAVLQDRGLFGGPAWGEPEP
ncbi:hypothetical protein J7F01_12635 [Streptomyces sp. ISL-22]|uniref:AMP-binding enzyme n=1 Tax=unclassified Streptomyces TaxID=2593676 RepID=UPI001BE959F8|nr:MULTISPECIES: hypothetical protein [unclassified Streptomyces]MBT2420358.1 hypothetical protein [Streptomyces sp. ISL-24]MBT2433028.1 hypothetical protein [Streptomyces sp. ISL-22]